MEKTPEKTLFDITLYSLTTSLCTLSNWCDPEYVSAHVGYRCFCKIVELNEILKFNSYADSLFRKDSEDS